MQNTVCTCVKLSTILPNQFSCQMKLDYASWNRRKVKHWFWVQIPTILILGTVSLSTLCISPCYLYRSLDRFHMAVCNKSPNQGLGVPTVREMPYSEGIQVILTWIHINLYISFMRVLQPISISYIIKLKKWNIICTCTYKSSDFTIIQTKNFLKHFLL